MDEVGRSARDAKARLGWLKRATAFFDGGVREVRGPHACSVVLEIDGEDPREEVLYLGPVGSSNIAEVNGLILALEVAQGKDVTHLSVRSDSQLTVNHALGVWRIKDPTLRDLHRRAQELARGFEEVKISHVPREMNKRADALCTELLDRLTGRKRGS